MKRVIRFRPSWLAYAGLISGAVLLAGWSVRGLTGLRTAEQERERRERDLVGLTQTVPAPTGKAAESLESLRKEAEIAVAEMEADFSVTTPHPAAPGNRSEAFFELARHAAAMRALAVGAGVACRDEEAFGFSAHARSGPTNALIASVHRQRLAAADLLTILFAARPVRFEGLQRERPGPGGAARGGGDFFEMDPAMSVRRPGLVETIPLRVVFIGGTGVLREFLNSLATAPSLFVVQDVAAEPAPDPAPTVPSAAWIPASGSRFTVTVEWLELIPSGERPVSP